jgi:hypothetical protein
MSFDSNSGNASVSRVIQKLEKKNRKLNPIFLGDEGREYFYWALLVSALHNWEAMGSAVHGTSLRNTVFF